VDFTYFYLNPSVVDYMNYLRAAAPAADPGKKKEVAEDIITETTGY
jgi:hypothetical protein